MRRIGWILPFAVLGAGAVAAAPAKRPAAPVSVLAAVNEARLEGGGRAARVGGIDTVLLKTQILLDRARFSPGAIDGRRGENFTKALAAFERASSLAADGKLDPESGARLAALSSEPVLVEYKVTEADGKGPFTEKIPAKLEEQVALERLGYRDAEEMLAERFHMDPALLRALNRGKRFDRPGETILVAKVAGEPAAGEAKSGARPREAARPVRRIEVLKGVRELRAYGEGDALVAVYPASVGSTEKPAPSGTHKVTAIAKNPTYTYSPDFAFRTVKAKERFDIKPGPNNPVGTIWIDLSLDTYGIHGTPEPTRVGKTASNGCIRLTNWDAEELAALVKPGVEVAFLD